METMSTRDVAYYLDCSLETVLNFARTGLLPGIRKGKKGRWRWEFRFEDVKALKDKYEGLDFDRLFKDLEMKTLLANKELLSLTTGRMSAYAKQRAKEIVNDVRQKVELEKPKGRS